MSIISSSLATILILVSLSTAYGNSEINKEGEIRLPSEKNNNGSEFCQGKVKQVSCPVKCFRADPVCGEDSVTYWCGCADALCHGVSVSKQGACDIGNGVGLSVPGQALLLIHIVWLMLLGFSILLGLF